MESINDFEINIIFLITDAISRLEADMIHSIIIFVPFGSCSSLL